MSASDLPNFELSESGSALHWDAGDVDLNLDGILYYVDPKVRREQDKASREEASRYAGAIRALREEHRLTQGDITGLTERQVRRVEQGESTPRSETLRKLAAAHGLSLDQYLKELAKRSKTRR
jgi:ribosome-binding protein aMBF1 (putative translation factor)